MEARGVFSSWEAAAKKALADHLTRTGRTGTVEDEQGWCVYVTCVDCGAQTAHASYESPEERLAAAQQVAHLWNVGKVLNPGVGD